MYFSRTQVIYGSVSLSLSIVTTYNWPNLESMQVAAFFLDGEITLLCLWQYFNVSFWKSSTKSLSLLTNFCTTTKLDNCNIEHFTKNFVKLSIWLLVCMCKLPFLKCEFHRSWSLSSLCGSKHGTLDPSRFHRRSLAVFWSILISTLSPTTWTNRISYRQLKL